MPYVAGTDAARASADARPSHGRKQASREAAHIHAGLARIIEDEILPHLALTHREVPRSRLATQSPTPERVVAFTNTLIGSDPSDEQVRAILEEGLPLDILLLDLLAPAARHLGQLWEEDEANFTDVTVALGRLHGLARFLCSHLEVGEIAANGRRVLLLPCPGETHLFSLALVASFFREAGWCVVLSASGDKDPTTLVRGERFDLIGISLSCDVHLPVMADLITRLRAASCNPDIRVIVGGALFLREPACAAAVGADAAAEDGRSAVRVAQALMVG